MQPTIALPLHPAIFGARNQIPKGPIEFNRDHPLFRGLKLFIPFSQQSYDRYFDISGNGFHGTATIQGNVATRHVGVNGAGFHTEGMTYTDGIACDKPTVFDEIQEGTEWAVCYRWRSSGNTYLYGKNLFVASATGPHNFRITEEGSGGNKGKLTCYIRDGASVVSSILSGSTYDDDVLHTLIWQKGSDGVRRLFVDLAADGTDSTSLGTVTLDAGSYLGNPGYSQAIEGESFFMGAWTRALSAAERAILTNNVQEVIQPKTNYFYIPQVAGGGTTYYQSIAGSVTGTGALTTQSVFTLAIAGAMTMTGALSKKISKTFSGAITATGAITKKTLKALFGSITPSGSPNKKTSRLLTGSVTATGALAAVLVAQQSIAGVITMTGVVSGIVGLAVVASLLRPVLRAVLRIVNRKV